MDDYTKQMIGRELERLREENSLLRNALGKVEWIGTFHPETREKIYRCPWCGATIIDNKVPPHNPNCERQKAISASNILNSEKEGGE